MSTAPGRVIATAGSAGPAAEAGAAPAAVDLRGAEVDGPVAALADSAALEAAPSAEALAGAADGSRSVGHHADLIDSAISSAAAIEAFKESRAGSAMGIGTS